MAILSARIPVTIPEMFQERGLAIKRRPKVDELSSREGVTATSARSDVHCNFDGLQFMFWLSALDIFFHSAF